MSLPSNAEQKAAAAAILDRLSRAGAIPGGASDDSRTVRAGDLFLALADDQAQNVCHINEAFARGACAALWEEGADPQMQGDWKLPHLAVRNLKALAGPIAHAVYGNPGARLALVAVTGTNGKTSITQWLAQALEQVPALRRCAVIGTLGAGFPGAMEETGLTTPQAPTLARCLAGFAAAGARVCALEASSIGIAEGRMNGAQVEIAVFTNLTRDHLDYHGSMDDYAAAKEALFHWPGLSTAIANLDDPFGARLLATTGAARKIGFTLGEMLSGCGNVDLLLRAEALRSAGDGLEFVLVTPAGRLKISSKVFGRYNVANLLAVAAVLLALGVAAEELPPLLSGLEPPPGRMQPVHERQAQGEDEPLVLVDYAHTPDALANVLEAIRETAALRGGRTFCVFGCGGGRDRGKRRQMGEIAARLADELIVTSDNPRNEDPLEIIAEILTGAPQAEAIPDRAAAIRAAVSRAGTRDVVLLAGKGHEATQEIAGLKIPFSDAQHASAALADWHTGARSC
ncbi:MAG: UDP-N-acetylmuramoyl-L-alanyl-D-glutamate--2,6-diaminopimelate ligase [Betaproteobacteria bacterium]|nr:UDP-N-acetylmuramoyl-L-alanyl-D-glutamate--2,6-diaminopimelate ligase [Betaproteobacteria bacterium]